MERLILGGSTDGQAIEMYYFKRFGTHRASAAYYEYSSGCGLGLYHRAGNFHLFAGNDPCARRAWNLHGPEIEQNARRTVEHRAAELARLIPKYEPKSYGWSFALLAESPHGPWVDVSGNPSGLGSAQAFKCFRELIAVPRIAAKSIASAYECPKAVNAIGSLLTLDTLTRDATVRIMGERFDAEAALRYATELGIQLGDGWARRRGGT